MAIDFTPERWEKIRDTYKGWWDGTLARPVLPVWLAGKDPGRMPPAVPYVSQAVFADLSISPEAIIDSFDYTLSSVSYLSNAFPFVGMAISGPGILAAFLGAELDCSTGQIWFHPQEVKPLSKLHFTYRDDTVWYRRIRDIYQAGLDRWQGQVLMGMPDLGGVLDVLAVFRSSENLLLDFYDEPEEVHRLIDELHSLWHRYYRELQDLLQPVNPGYSDWSQVYSDVPSYIPQADLSYMISTDMFKEFALPELAETFHQLPHTIYHLDGKGELPHLDTLLANKEVDGIQWVPGEGEAPLANWPEVYRKIHAAGKRIHMYGALDTVDTIASQIGTFSGIYNAPLIVDGSEEKTVRARLETYDIE